MSSGALANVQYLYLDNNQIGDEVSVPASRAHALSRSQPAAAAAGVGGGEEYRAGRGAGGRAVERPAALTPAD